MAIEQVTDHAVQAYGRLLSQFKEQPNWLKLINLKGARYQELEDMLFAMLSGRSIYDAADAQLDGIANLLGVTRPPTELASTDLESYRNYLQAKVVANRSEGNPEELLAILKLLASERTQFLEIAYLYEEQVLVRLAAKGTLTTTWPLAMDLLRRATPIGVRLQLSGNELWWPDRMWGEDDVWPEYRYTDGLWGADGLWGESAYWGGDLVA